MELTDFKVLTFDCYGTLIDWETGILGALRPLVAKHGVKLSDAELLALYGELEARIEAGLDTVDAGLGTLLTFEPGERHSVRSENGAQIILLLSPWPGEGHYPDSQDTAPK